MDNIYSFYIAHRGPTVSIVHLKIRLEKVVKLIMKCGITMSNVIFTVNCL